MKQNASSHASTLNILPHEPSSNPTKAKINISAFRILLLLKLLSQRSSISLDDLNNCFANHPLIKRTFTDETLRKYFHTLTMLDCHVKRNENKANPVFTLENHLGASPMPKEYVDAIQVILTALYTQPLKTNYHKLKAFMDWVIPGKLDDLTQSIDIPESHRHTINQFEKYCFDNQLIEIEVRYQLISETGTPFHKKFVAKPLKLASYKGDIHLEAVHPETFQKIRVPLHHIRSHQQLPNLSNIKPVPAFVTFQLTGRLVHNYRPYPYEQILHHNDYLLIKARTDELSVLLQRLLKYGEHCEVLEPKSARQAMKELISGHLKTLRQCDENDLQDLLSKAQTNETLRKWVCHLGIPQT